MALFDWLFGGSKRKNQAVGVSPDGKVQQPYNASKRQAPPEVSGVPEGRYRFIALDVETACSDVSSICQIGLACVQADNQIVTFSMLVNPGTKFDPFNEQLHGIGPRHVIDAPHFPTAIGSLLPLLAKHHLIQHSNFDKQAITAACVSHGLPIPNLRWSDSVTIARRAWPELKENGGHGLASLKRALNLEFKHHDAGEDARAAAMVVLKAEAKLAMNIEQLTQPLPKRGYAPKIYVNADPSGPLAGAVAAFTGTLSLTRTEAAQLAASAGIEVKSGITKKTTHLIVGDQDLSLLAGHEKSAKHRKAEGMQKEGHPIQIIGESEFKRLIQQKAKN